MQKGRGGGEVLALGNPNYTNNKDLQNLPSTLDEIGAIVGENSSKKDPYHWKTKRGEAFNWNGSTESNLRKALQGKKHRASVHFACHGLLKDRENPLRSSLALTPEGEDDGFLNCREIFDLDLNSDMAVLSACETGKGKVYDGEGIVGLTRAFMYAGAPRVLCSLWKVDDDATKALMTKFYELWNPKEKEKRMGAAKALREAQEHIREKEEWKHPYYWAPWVLWGVPE